MMGDKVTAKQTMIKTGVPCVPGSEGALPDDPKEIVKIARQVGYPVIVKAAGGGGTARYARGAHGSCAGQRRQYDARRSGPRIRQLAGLHGEIP